MTRHWPARDKSTKLRRVFPPVSREEWPLELPTRHRVPIGWLRAHACPAIKWRTVNDILPAGAASPEDYQALRRELHDYKRVTQTLKKQKKDGTWADNILGLRANKTQGIKGPGTVSRYRHLLELGYGRDERPMKLAERIFFRLLSRDEQPELLFEYRSQARKNADLTAWGRNLLREGAAAALAHSGLIEDPRVRGAAHRVATAVSQFLRSDVGSRPVVRKGSRNVLHPEAYPPTYLSVAMLAYMPNLQRERAGFIDRLCSYLALPQTKRKYVIVLGRKVIQPEYQILGNPIEADRSGGAKDLPLALHWIELLVRMEQLHTNDVAQRVLAHALAECDKQGVWTPHNLRAFPRSVDKVSDFYFPLEADARTMESRQADVTFRLALIAKLAGWELDYT